MKNRIKRLFTTNIGWKIAAVFIGIIIWAVLSNTQDPITSRTVNVPITYLNENKLLRDEKLVFLRGPETVTINVDVRTSDIRKLSASLFTCTADLIDHSGGDLSSQRIHIDVSQVGGNDVIVDWSYYRNDPNITVSMDEYIEKTFTVMLKQEGSLPEETLFQNPPTFSPEKITVSGPKSRFGNLSAVKAPVNLTSLSEQGAGNVELHDIVVSLYDANDAVISNADGALKLSQETVSMTASIARIRDVSISLEDTTGTPAEGFRKIKTSLSRSVVSVRGLLGTLSSFDTIVIPASLVNIDGISQDTEYTIDLADLLPQGLTVAEGSSTVTVYVTVEALVGAEYAYNTSNIMLTGEDELYLYSFESDTVPIRVRGFQEDLDLLDVNASVSATADVSGLRPGTHTVKVAISGPLGYYYDNADSITVRVTVKINEAMTTTTEEETTESESEEESSSGDLEESSGSETESDSNTETESDVESTESTSESESESESEGEPEAQQAEDQ